MVIGMRSHPEADSHGYAVATVGSGVSVGVLVASGVVDVGVEVRMEIAGVPVGVDVVALVAVDVIVPVAALAETTMIT